MSKHKKKHNYISTPSNKTIEMIERNRHYVDAVKKGLISLYKLDPNIQREVRNAYQELANMLRDTSQIEFMVNRIMIELTHDNDDIKTREDWEDYIKEFFYQDVGMINFGEYDDNTLLITICYDVDGKIYEHRVASFTATYDHERRTYFADNNELIDRGK